MLRLVAFLPLVAAIGDEAPSVRRVQVSPHADSRLLRAEASLLSRVDSSVHVVRPSTTGPVALSNNAGSGVADTTTGPLQYPISVEGLQIIYGEPGPMGALGPRGPRGPQGPPGPADAGKGSVGDSSLPCAGIVAYERCGFSGWSLPFVTGDYLFTNQDAAFQSISSLRVPVGCSAYLTDKFGNVQLYQDDVSCLGDPQFAFDKQAIAVQVRTNSDAFT